MKRILILLVLTALPASAQQFQHEGLKPGMTIDQAKSTLLIHYAEQQIDCHIDGPYSHYCVAYETFGHRPVRGYPGLQHVPSVNVTFGKTSNRVCVITATDPITPFEVFRSSVIQAYGNPNRVEEDGNDLEWSAPSGEHMRVYQYGGSSHLEIRSNTYR
jgi:hypothetical protein